MIIQTMKTTRKIITVSVLGMMVLLASCNKETLSGRSSGGMNDEPPAGKSVSIIQAKRDFAAEVLARCMANYPDAYQQLNNVIAVVRSYGVDEHIYVHDILHREHSDLAARLFFLRHGFSSRPLFDLYQQNRIQLL